MSDGHHKNNNKETRKSRTATNSTISFQAEENVQPDSVACSVASSTEAATASTASSRKPAPTPAPVAFVEKDLVEDEEEINLKYQAAVPETITSGITSTGSRAGHKTTKEQFSDDNSTNNTNDGVAIKEEDSLTADNETNNKQQKRRNQDSTMPIKWEELPDNNYDANSTNRTKSSRRKRKQHQSSTLIPTNDFVQTNNKKKRNNNQQGGEPAVVNSVRRTSPRRNKKHQEEEEEEYHKDNTTSSSTIDNNNNETSCCRFCNDPDWESKIYYKCGTVLSKYFPKSNNNPNPGWYKGTIRVHYVSDYEYKEEADSSNKEESEQQYIVLNEIHYDDGDVENITQDDLKLQVVGGRKVRILHPTKMETVSNSESYNPGNVVLTTTSSGNKYDRNWIETYERLKQFKAKNGHCRVPAKYGSDPSLGKWVRKQRVNRKMGKLAEDRTEKLNKIGFDWDPFERTWDEMFGRLEKFKTDNGHCRVPQRYGSDPCLGKWVINQRHIFKEGKMAPDRAEKLAEIGFEWDPFDRTWDEMFGKLEQFKAETGRCRVPWNYDLDPQLGNWVKRQRNFHKKGKIAKDRIERLEAIGFEWNLRN